jgi:hypothetical protein
VRWGQSRRCRPWMRCRIDSLWWLWEDVVVAERER